MRHRRFLPFALAAVCPAVVGGCVLDSLGWGEDVTQTSTLFSPPAILDDTLADKHPVFDASLTVSETIADCTYTINKSGAITKLDLPGYTAQTQPLQNRLFHGYTAAVAELAGQDVLPSMEVIEAAQKPFDDGLYAAVELGAEDGSSGSPIQKRALFDAVLAQLVKNASAAPASEQPFAKEAAAQLAAAIELGGGSPTAPADVLSASDSLRTAFLADPIFSKPIGFYAWNDALSKIFQRDRFLQAYISPPSFGAQAAAAHAIDGSGHAADYGQVLDLYAGMTDAYFHLPISDLLPAASAAGAFDDLAGMQATFTSAHRSFGAMPASCAARLAMLPPSESPDERIFRQQFCGTTLPPGTNLLDVLVNLIRAGTVDLTPAPGSGWASQQLYALETLLVPEKAPERDHLFLTAAYKQKLISTFKTIVTENRETQVKQDEIGGSKSVSVVEVDTRVDVYPLLPVEPFPTYYLRTARGYRFVKALLGSVMGPGFLTTAHRWIEDGTTSSLTLGAELDAVILRDYGFYAMAADAVGYAPALAPGEDDGIDLNAARSAAKRWLSNWTRDVDLGRDPRVIVPEFIDPNASTMHYWAMVGVQALPMRASFVDGFTPKLTDTSCATGSFVQHDYVLLTGKTIEVAIPLSKPPPTRAEFRAVCDANDSSDAIAAALESP